MLAHRLRRWDNMNPKLENRSRGIDERVCYFENKFVYLTLYTLLANPLIAGPDYIWLLFFIST